MDATMTGSMTDEARLEAAADELTQILNAGCLSLMLSLGHRAGLFSTLATTGPVTSDGLATAAGLNERYVREWLGAMTIGGSSSTIPKRRRTGSPPTHAACSPRAAWPDNRRVHPVRVGAGRSGGRAAHVLPRGRWGAVQPLPRFHEVMADDSGQTVARGAAATILPLVPGLTERLEQGSTSSTSAAAGAMAMLHLAKVPDSRSPASTSRRRRSNARARRGARAACRTCLRIADATPSGPHASVRPGPRLRRHPRSGPARRVLEESAGRSGATVSS